ncbi:MAG: sigma-70 family RNA polymerase sigma factor [Candidatus Adlerbacteria bacterium]|nr:sigma-70 family RNA polymerase sigma factor [Candidatus Adlerbacteria bacterium]
MGSGNLRKQFEGAFDRYSDGLFRYCFLRLSDRERAKEIAQECFMKAWEYAYKGEPIDNMRVFLYRIAHNLVVNEYRDRKHNLSLETLMETGFDQETDARTPEEEAEVRQAITWLDKLEPMYRQIMVLRYVEDLPVKEIAQILGETETAVSVKIHRAIKKLQQFANQ